MRIAVLGAGAVGGALARELAARGREVVLWSRSSAKARAAARGTRVTVERDLARALEDAELVLLCASDAGLAELVARVAALPLAPRARVALHTSGALGARALAPLERRGFGTCALHPLVPVPRDAAPGAFEGVGFALEARDPNVRAVATALARELGGEPFELSARDAKERARYHAAATPVSNGALALVSLALDDVLPPRLAHAKDRTLARSLAILLERTARNLRELPPERALTGPAARGDLATLHRHLATLPRRSPTRTAYAALTRELVRLAQADRRIPPSTARSILTLLEKPTR